MTLRRCSHISCLKLSPPGLGEVVELSAHAGGGLSDVGTHPGEEYAERASFAQLAFHAHFSAEQLAELLDNRKPQAGAGVFAGQVVGIFPGNRTSLAEFLEDDLSVRVGNSYAGVADPDLNHPPRRSPCADSDAA